jgi:GntR family transcriptional regulator
MSGSGPEDVSGSELAGLGFRPLYRQVRDALIRRIVDRVWLPGEPLPSEMQLAADLGVSQGTVRKALDAMAAENLVVRRQGRGTYVARHDEERVLFQFFKLVPDEGARSFPQSQVLSCISARANAAECQVLNLKRSSRIIRIRRIRSIDGRPVVAEALSLPEALFPGLSDMELPNNLYGLYAMSFGLSVASTTEKLKAVSAEPADAAALQVAPNTALLKIDRLAFSLDQVPIEWRVSLCLTETTHYETDLR